MTAAKRGLDLEAARLRTIPDVLPEPGRPLRVLFCGINPGLYSAATGWHFARPGNRFWPALHRSGFTPRLLAPREQDLLPAWGLGITNLVPRATAQAAELTAAELRAGGERLEALVREHRPRIVAIAGVTAYRTAFARPRAATGPQPDPLAGARLWVLPNPSGLNAHWTLPALAAEFAALRAAAEDQDLFLCRTDRRASPPSPPDSPPHRRPRDARRSSTIDPDRHTTRTRNRIFGEDLSFGEPLVDHRPPDLPQRSELPRWPGEAVRCVAEVKQGDEARSRRAGGERRDRQFPW